MIFNRKLKKRIESLEFKLEQLVRLNIAIAKIMNINPKLLKEESQDTKSNAEYLIKMVEKNA